MIPYSRPKLSDLYTLSQSKLLENHTLTAAHTYIAHIWQHPPPPGTSPSNAFAYKVNLAPKRSLMENTDLDEPRRGITKSTRQLWL